MCVCTACVAQSGGHGRPSLPLVLTFSPFFSPRPTLAFPFTALVRFPCAGHVCMHAIMANRRFTTRSFLSTFPTCVREMDTTSCQRAPLRHTDWGLGGSVSRVTVCSADCLVKPARRTIGWVNWVKRRWGAVQLAGGCCDCRTDGPQYHHNF